VATRRGDYAEPATLDVALAGIGRVLLISSSAIGQRAAQHGNVIAAARHAGVGQIVYTSILHADTSPLGLAVEHVDTEAALKASGVPFVVLRNGWYNENHAAGIPSALAHHAVFGSAGDGRFSSAARVDFAAAAAVALTTAADWNGRVFELAGDDSYTLTDLAAELTKQSGEQIGYVNLPEADFKAALLGAGLPEPIANLLSNSDAGAAKGGLFDDSHQLSTLIGRPTTKLAATIAQALAKR